jgi:hypothetical protein
VPSKNYDFTDGIDDDAVDNVVVAASATNDYFRTKEGQIQHGTI